MSFDVIALAVLISGWLICGVVPWLVLSVLTRGQAGLGMLPLSMFVAVVAAMAVPILGATGSGGLWLSFVVAILVPGALLATRRFAIGAVAEAKHEANADVHPGAPGSVR